MMGRCSMQQIDYVQRHLKRLTQLVTFTHRHTHTHTHTLNMVLIELWVKAEQCTCIIHVFHVRIHNKTTTNQSVCISHVY